MASENSVQPYEVKFESNVPVVTEITKEGYRNRGSWVSLLAKKFWGIFKIGRRGYWIADPDTASLYFVYKQPGEQVRPSKGRGIR